jgi:hypothetical protein
MIYSLIKRIPGSQGTKVCRIVWHGVVLGNEGDMKGSVRGVVWWAYKSHVDTLTLSLLTFKQVLIGTTLMLTVGSLPFWAKRCTYRCRGVPVILPFLPPSLRVTLFPFRVYPTRGRAHRRGFFLGNLCPVPLSQSTHPITVCCI